jgi:hypothetical protein
LLPLIRIMATATKRDCTRFRQVSSITLINKFCREADRLQARLVTGKNHLIMQIWSFPGRSRNTIPPAARRERALLTDRVRRSALSVTWVSIRKQIFADTKTASIGRIIWRNITLTRTSVSLTSYPRRRTLLTSTTSFVMEGYLSDMHQASPWHWWLTLLVQKSQVR